MIAEAYSNITYSTVVRLARLCLGYVCCQQCRFLVPVWNVNDRNVDTRANNH